MLVVRLFWASQTEFLFCSINKFDMSIHLFKLIVSNNCLCLFFYLTLPTTPSLSVSAMSKIERSRYNDNISISLLFDIADGLQIDITMLVTFSDLEKNMWWKPLNND